MFDSTVQEAGAQDGKVGRRSYLDCYRLAIVHTAEEATPLSGHDELAQLHTLQHPSHLCATTCLIDSRTSKRLSARHHEGLCQAAIGLVHDLGERRRRLLSYHEQQLQCIHDVGTVHDQHASSVCGRQQAVK